MPLPTALSTRAAPYAKVGPQTTAAHHIGSSAQIDLTHDNEGDQHMIGDIGATFQPIEISGSTSLVTHVAPPNMDAFFDRDSAVVVREIMLTDGTLMRELRRMSPSATHARLESEVQEFMTACQAAEGRAGSVEQRCHDAVVQTREQARLMLAHQSVEFQRASQDFQSLARAAEASEVQEAERRAQRTMDFTSASLRTQLSSALDGVQRTRTSAVTSERVIEESAHSETTNYREEI